MPNVSDFEVSTAVQPGDVITSALMNSVLDRLEQLERRALDVRLLPTQLLNGAHTLVALGGAFGQPGGIWLNDSPLLPAAPAAGINMAILSPNLTVKFWSVYATGGIAAESQRLAHDLASFAAPADVIAAITQDAFAEGLQPAARDALAWVGGGAFRLATPRDSIAFIGVAPATTGMVFNYLVSNVPVDGQGAGLPFVWAVYSTPLRRFLVGGGAGGAGISAAGAVAISSLRFEPPTPVAGTTATATLTLSASAPTDLSVTLNTGNAAVAQLTRTTVQIAQGQNTVTFPVSAVAAGQVSISAALPNQPPTSASLTVQPAPAALSVVQVTLNPNPAAVGTSVTGTVVLSGPAVAGTTVALASGNTQVATVQQAVVTPTVGQNSAQFQVAAIGAGTTDIRASLGTSSQISTLTVEKPKETKEGKERKDTKEKEKEQKEKEKDTKEKDTKEAAKDRLDKLQAVEKRVEKVRDLQEFGREPNIPGGMGLAQDTRLDQGQAFIRPAERPAIGQDFQVQALDGG